MRRASYLEYTAAAALLLLFPAGLGATATAADGVVLFAPGECVQHQATPCHAAAAEQIRRRLLKTGMPESRIEWLHGKQATAKAFSDALAKMADSTESSDLLLVVMCSPGVQIANGDYVFAADAPKEHQQGLAERSPQMLSIREVLREMEASPSKRRVLIVDGAGAVDASFAEAAAQFGHAPLEPSDGQWVILNQSNAVGQRPGQSPMTDFMWSFVDGVAFHADGNRDGSVSVLELADYMKLYAEEQRSPLPCFAGKTTGDAVLLPTSIADDETFPREALAANAKCLAAEAQKALLLEMDLQGAQTLLTRANRLCADAELKREIDDLSTTASILGGKPEVLPLEASDGVAFAAVLPRDAGIFSPGATQPSRRLPAGTVVQLSYRSVSTAGTVASTYVYAVGASRPQWNAGQISFSPVEIDWKPAWMLASDLAASQDQAVPSASLREEFLKPDAVERPATTDETGKTEETDEEE